MVGSGRARDWWTDWRLWVLVAVMVGLFSFDVLVPPVVVLPLVAVPVVVASALFPPLPTAILAGLMVAMGAVSGIANDYFAHVNDWLWLAAMAIVGATAVLLSMRRTHVEEESRRVAAAVEARERDFRLLAENASDVVFLAGPDRRITWVSSNVVRALGWAPEELVGTLSVDLAHDEDRPRIDAIWAAALAGAAIDEAAEDLVVRVRTRSGQSRWMSAKMTADVSDGEAARTVIGLRNVDALVRSRLEAKESLAQVRAALDAEFDPHVMLAAVRDSTGRIVDFVYVDANPAACEYNGMPYEELLGQRLLDLLPGHYAVGLLRMCADVVETGEPLVLNDYTYALDFAGGEERRYDIRGLKAGESISYTWRDVTERYREARRIEESEETYRLLAENSSDVVVHIREGVVVWVSPSLTAAVGWTPEEWLGRKVVDFADPEEVAGSSQDRAAVYRGERPTFRMRLRASDGDFHWVDVHAKPYVDAAGRTDGVIASFRLADTLVATEAELERRATYDDLTGALKREEALAQLDAIGSHNRVPGSESGVLFIDVDDFKAVNDLWGHAAGDTLLRTLASRTRAIVRAGDTIARLGGDEFLVVLDAIHDLDEATAVAEKIRCAVAQPVPTREGPVTATVSIGVTIADPIETADEMTARADAAMYEAKKSGRNQVVAVPI
jgi:diguanylate cyclase (GGDEF)-like protein/PAS domain S-box-containing protein